MANNTGKATSNRTPQWRNGEHAQVRCVNCQHVYDVDGLDPELRCPKCNHTDWVPLAPASGERVQRPSN